MKFVFYGKEKTTNVAKQGAIALCMMKEQMLLDKGMGAPCITKHNKE